MTPISKISRPTPMIPISSCFMVSALMEASRDRLSCSGVVSFLTSSLAPGSSAECVMEADDGPLTVGAAVVVVVEVVVELVDFLAGGD